MYKLLIVDDEYQSRKGLRDLFDWGKMGVTVVADASDGDEALPLLKELRPDILLTDVRMHRMDGLELAREARKLLPGIGIVFISGYSDADYLRDALQVEAMDYIYKPIRLTELQKAMQRVIDRLDQQNETRVLLEKSKPLLAERFLRSWFHGRMDDEQAIRDKLHLLRMSFPEDEGVLAVAFQPEWEEVPESGQMENFQIVLEERVRKGLDHVLTCAEDTGVVALLSAGTEDHPRQVETELHGLGQRIRQETGTPVLMGVSRRHENWLEAPQAVKEARYVIAHQVFPSENKVLLYEDEPAQELSAVSLLDGDLLERYALSGNLEALLARLEEALAEAGPNVQASRKLLMSVALRVDLALQRQGVESMDSLTFCRHAMSYQSLPGIKSSLMTMLQKACERVEDQRNQTYSPVVERVFDIIRVRYGEHLSVNAIAEEVHYSAAHLSTLFKKETGTTLSEAILNTRLKAAMDQLRTTIDPVSAIAARTGYADVQYFSRVFKQFTGFTPLEYRRKALSC